MERSKSVSAFWFPVASLMIVLIGIGCSNQKSSGSDIKFNQYFVQGELLYTKHCSNCHQPNGTGLGRVYPPLNKSDFMDNHFDEVICLMKYGKEGEMLVNGIQFNQPMPGVSSLTDIEIAEIATYIYNTWSHEKKDISLHQVSGILRNCKNP